METMLIQNLDTTTATKTGALHTAFFFFFFSPAEYNSFPYLTRLTSSVPRVPSAARLFLNCMMASEAVRVKSTEV